MTKPRNVRNFWIEASIDGRVSTFAGGPKASNGGFYLTVKQRSNGDIAKALAVQGFVGVEGDLHLVVRTFWPDVTDDPAKDSGRFLCEIIEDSNNNHLHIVSPR